MSGKRIGTHVLFACKSIIIVQSVDGIKIDSIPLRDQMYQGQTPQSFNIKKLQSVYAGLTEEEIDTNAAKNAIKKNKALEEATIESAKQTLFVIVFLLGKI